MLVLGEIGLNLGPLLASAGIAGLAIGFGAQNLVKDFIAGLFMLLEDQYGIGDVVDIGEAVGTVEAVGLRITTLRDGSGVLWYVRNGEIVRVGNKSQGWAVVNVDVPVGFVASTRPPRCCARRPRRVAEDPDFVDDIIGRPRCWASSRSPPRVRSAHDGEDRDRGAVAGRSRTPPAVDRRTGEGRDRRADHASRMFIRPPADAGAGTDTGQAGPT